MSGQPAEVDRKVTEWAVRANGYLHPFVDENVARIVHREQGGELLSRVVTYAEWRRVTTSE